MFDASDERKGGRRERRGKGRKVKGERKNIVYSWV
jgi:hypothetical protein